MGQAALAGLLGFGLLLAVLVALHAAPLYAQEQVGSYTVQSGDTLATIAERFGVALDTLIAINNIQNRDLISVGQVLLIPTADSALATLPTTRIQAQPGDTLVDVARRYGQDPQLLTTINAISMTTRLFPGQPIALPTAALVTDTLRFGAVTRIATPTTLVQGRTGQLTVDSNRPLSLTASWNGLDLPLLPIDDRGDEQMALLPVPALIAPAFYTLTIGYTTTTGVYLRQDRQIAVVAGPYDSQEIVLPDDKGSLLAPEIANTELTTMTAVWSQVTPTLWWRAPFTRPIGSQYATTSPYGTRRSYDGGPYNSYHAGQDFGAPAGVPILAPAAGRVALAAPLQIRGNAVLLDHGGGIYTGYWHMTEIHVTEGQMVEAGDVLGLVGTTGLSTGAHLHWELRIYGIAVDPLQFLSEPLVHD
ncbi:MAG: peptidoglycan DD-metalloendopeptidase family protein [Caldilineaceae bacterium]|nr:peptidoglycan DD-metalloendopeptidase family protein [Caldilineaceae bacterium]